MSQHQTLPALLESIGGASDFASQHIMPLTPIGLTVSGVGNIPLPISVETAEALIGVATPAQHGYKEETRFDPRVRDTFEIDCARIHFDETRWQPALQAALEKIAQSFGISPGCSLKAELHNMLIYRTGQFFLRHRDSEKLEGMIASLVVSLPSRFAGGETIVLHQGDAKTFRSDDKALSFAAFFADCRHEVKPVTSGHRVVLTYNLWLQGNAQASPIEPAKQQRLADHLRTYFAANKPPRWTGDEQIGPPDRLVYLLDHQYTQRGLEWNYLKGADSSRAVALRHAAETTGCDVALALVDVHEVWDCTERPYRSRRHGRRTRFSFDDDIDPEPDGESVIPSGKRMDENYEVTDLIDSEASIRHLVKIGKALPAMPVAIEPHELFCTKPTARMEPYESEYEPYTGNAGNTMDRWYSRAALVIWPQTRSFAMRAQVDPKWAIEEVLQSCTSNDPDMALALVRQVMPFWAAAIRRGEHADALAPTLKVAAAIKSPIAAMHLLSPFAITALDANMAEDCVACLDVYGLEWLCERLAGWRSERGLTPEDHLH
ncbi:hypothetical protein C7S18_04555 [Ahniella affigens]|uniref:Fe2OG dioxygenase domain-containing protein n=1 Tax=Ahniella affigens TaxID=2021234 RepID=A0A2P1PNT8_9GAMM|nr:2OG-Fe(II) oxygenase [Ahniella affigens]AVP96512.1 hypothetical protein C7S18_04555 [Ahniella affigens]